ncbi:MAG: CPBP family intramembrane metalloprotease [Phycisphaerae bacterium]|nr:CPBP family intramembrane metalloprotease [Phycisphaerae bacterium]
MTRRDRWLRGRSETYARQTLRPVHSLLFVLPMLAFFHVGTFSGGSDLLALYHLRRLLGYFNATLALLPPALIVVVLLAQQTLHHDGFRVRPRVLAGMCGEAVGWVLPLIALGHITGRLWLHQAGGADASAGLLQELCVAVGAGAYEEFVFRMALIGLLMLLLVDVFELNADGVALASVLVTAAAFSAYHLSPAVWSGADAVAWDDFLFRWIAGVYLGVLFLYRGYGIAAGAHAVYNLYTVAYHY